MRGAPVLAAGLIVAVVLAVAASHRAQTVAGQPAPAFARLAAPAAPAGVAARPRWRPDVSAAAAYARRRTGVISFGIRTPHHLYGRDVDRQVRSASVVKAMLMVAYLNSRDVRGRRLRGDERRLLGAMITRSDNEAASRVRDIVGNRSLERLARRVGMRAFRTAPSWGASLITVRDQTRLFLRIERYVVARHRREALHLLGSVVPEQRWGIAAEVPAGWGLYFKGGWVRGTQNQVGLLRRGRRRVAIAVFVTGPRDYIDGRRSERGVAARLLHGLDENARPR